jgi:hypothetical protein
MRSLLCISIALVWSAALAAWPDDAKGLWMTDEKDAVIKVKGCAAQAVSRKF